MRAFMIVHALLWAVASTAPTDAETPAGVLRALPDKVAAKIVVRADVVTHAVSPFFVGTNLTQHEPDRTRIGLAETVKSVRGMGIRSVRFPNGCLADRYNWLQPSSKQMAVEQFIEFCDAIEAEPYYTLNMQGGSEGLEGSPPENAPLEQRIKYRHTAPNPCGNTDYHFGTLAEAIALLEKHTLERALAGKTPITHFELGNENWGQAKTDWPPDVYGKTCEVYAAALRQRLAEGRRKDSRLAGLELYITMVGFPTMGNNMDPFKSQDRSINVAWTNEVNRLADLRLIDAVQEHFYPYGGNDGGTLFWTVHNLRNILALRHGRPNERLGGYADRELAYRLPVEFTEWNVKCWGPGPRGDLPMTNGSFEKGLTDWSILCQPEGQGTAKAVPAAARRGKVGLQLRTGDAEWVEARHVISVADRKPAALVGYELWLRTERPRQVWLTLRQSNAGEHHSALLIERAGTRAGAWEHVVVQGKPFEDTTEIEAAVRLAGPGSTVWLDEVRPLYWPTVQGSAPLVTGRFEQQLFIADALRELLEWPTPRTHFHHLFGNYGCPTLSADGSDRDNAKPFRLLDDRIGNTVIGTDCEVPTFDYDTPADAYATDFNALAPDMKDIPALGVIATRRGRDVFLLMINRTTDRPIEATIRFEGVALTGQGDVRTLTGQDLDLQGATVTAKSVRLSNPITHVVPPLSAQVLHATADPTSRPTRP